VVPLVILLTAPLLFSAQGRQALDGLWLWQSDVNSRDGIAVAGSTQPVRLIFYDDQKPRQSGARKRITLAAPGPG
jgi:hypothetical protein